MELSIIIPVYNVEKYLRECLDSIVAIENIDYEVILVNDGSKDGSLDIAIEYKKIYPQIKLVSQINSGQSSAKNRGLEIARGEYITFVDSDDYIITDEFVKFFESVKKDRVDIGYTELIKYFCSEKRFDKISQGKKEKLKKLSKRDVKTGHSYFEYADRNGLFRNEVTGKLYRRQFLESCNLKFEEGLIFEDLLFTRQEVDRAKKIKYYNYFFYVYRIRENSIMTSLDESKKYHYYKIIETVLKEFRDSKSKRLREQGMRIYFSALKKYPERVLSLEKKIWKTRGSFLYKMRKRIQLSLRKDLKIKK